MKQVLIGGCSFSQNTGFPSEDTIPKWTSWTDFFDKEYGDKFKIINKSQSSFGQSKIVESLVEELITNNFHFDYVIIQWSAVGRAYSTNEKDFFNRMIIQSEIPFSPHQHEYIVNNDKEGWVTNLTTQISTAFYRASLNQIYLMKTLLEQKNIPYKMFWGWQQINDEIEKDNKDILDLIYDDCFWRYKNHGGMSEYIVDTIGKENGIIKKDFHPTTIGQQHFYNTIIKDIIKNL